MYRHGNVRERSRHRREPPEAKRMRNERIARPIAARHSRIEMDQVPAADDCEIQVPIASGRLSIGSTS